MSKAGLSRSRRGRMHDVMASYDNPARLDVAASPDVCRDFWTLAYQATDRLIPTYGGNASSGQATRCDWEACLNDY